MIKNEKDLGMTMQSLSVSNLKVRYHKFEALKGIDLNVEPGEFVALLGPSGCGKTTLLRAIAGFVDANEGNILLKGQDVAGRLPRDRNIGIVFQSYALFPHMTAFQNVCFGLECRNVPKQERIQRAEATLNLVGLSEFAGRYPRQMSGGQQQRVALARALVIKPDLLLLDEPLGALDKQLRTQMQTELKLLQKRLGVTAIFVTHDQEEAMSMADRIVVMRHGKIEQIATPEILFTRPETSWVCEFVGAGNLIGGPFDRTNDGWMQAQIAPGSGIRFKGEPSSTCLLQVPFDKLQVEPHPGSPLTILDKRFLGATWELHVEAPGRRLIAHTKAESANRFQVGQPVSVSASEDAVRLVRSS